MCSSCNEVIQSREDILWNLWEESHREMARLGQRKGGLRGYFKGFLGIAFTKVGLILGCMDDRVPCSPKLPGSGMLLAWRSGISYALQVIRETGATSITTHEQCGAARMVARDMGIPFLWFADFLARLWGYFVSWKLGIPYLEHLPVAQPFHAAFAVYVDATGRFNQLFVPLAVPGFTVNVKPQGLEEASRDLKVAIQLAFESAFGERFTEREGGRPFLVVVIGDPRHHDRSEKRVCQVVKKVIEEHSHAPRMQLTSFSPRIGDFPSCRKS